MDAVATLASSWPPEEPIGAFPDELSLADSHLLDALVFEPTAFPSSDNATVRAVTVARHASGHLVAAPVVRVEGGPWRRGAAGDGVAAALCGSFDADAWSAPFAIRSLPARLPRPRGACERAITADQTNESVIVGDDGGDQAIVKWIRTPCSDHPATLLLAHLAEVGFTGVPTSYGRLVWLSPDGNEIVLAFVDAYLDGARDGWEWCVDDLLAHLDAGTCDAEFSAPLGQLVAELHVALATPSTIQPEPMTHVGAATTGGWKRAAQESLAEALRCTPGPDGEELGRLRPAISAAIHELDHIERTPVLRIHGDLHVGQVLRWSDGLAVIDFDGNPTLTPSVGMAPAPLARDVAQMLRSIDHVARIANRRTDGRHADDLEHWVEASRSAFLEAYRKGLAEAGVSHLFDDRLLVPFEAEQECRELIYASRFLPRWRYAPMAALRALFPTTS